MDEKKSRDFRKWLEKETNPHAREEFPSYESTPKTLHSATISSESPTQNYWLERTPEEAADIADELAKPRIRWDLPWGTKRSEPDGTYVDLTLTAEDYEAIVEAEPDEPTPALSDLMDEAEEKYYEPSRPGDEEWYLNCLCAQLKLNGEDTINAVRYLRNRVHRMEQWHYEVHERTLEMQEYVDHLAEKLYELLNKED